MAVLTPTQIANISEALARWRGYYSMSDMADITLALDAAVAGEPVTWHKAALAALDVPQLDQSCLAIAISLACIDRAPRYRRRLAATLNARVARYHGAAA